MQKATLEWFGASTFRLRAKGLTIWLDSWLDRPATVRKFSVSIADVKECDYILTSHAHFDHIPGADRIAKQTGGKIVGNGEVMRVMRDAGVPEDQLIGVAGGETIDAGEGVVIRVFPSLHCLPFFTPGSPHPEFLKTDTEYLGGRDFCTLDGVKFMKAALGGMIERPASDFAADPMKLEFRRYLADPQNHFSWWDGGQMMYLITIAGEGSLLYSSHTGAYEGVMRDLRPQPDVAILGAAGRPNLNGQPYMGTPAEFLTREVEWLGHPKKVIWCLHDDAPILPKYVDTTAAKKMVQDRTLSEVIDLDYEKPYSLFQN